MICRRPFGAWDSFWTPHPGADAPGYMPLPLAGQNSRLYACAPAGLAFQTVAHWGGPGGSVVKSCSERGGSSRMSTLSSDAGRVGTPPGGINTQCPDVT